MHRTLPANEHLQQIDQRIAELKEDVLSNIKDSQILRSNFTTMLHSYKESNEKIKEDVLDTLANFKSELFSHMEEFEEDVKEIQASIVSINLDRRYIQDEILLLDKKIEEVEVDFGVPNYES